MGNPEELDLIFQGFLSKYGGKKLAIATHSRADVDALSSAYALSKLLPGSIICTAEEMGEGAKQLAERFLIQVQDLESVDRSAFDGLIVVDTSAYTLLPQARGWKILCIIDHHRPEGRDMKAEFEIVDPEAPSSAEIVANLLTPDRISQDVAFGLAVGIIADGARFKSARSETFRTLAWLMEKAKAPYDELLAIAEPEPKEEAKLAVLKAMRGVRVQYGGGYLIATSETDSNESDAASLITEAADVAFVARWKDREKETRISARARKGVSIPLNQVMGEVGKELGGAGGGHAKASGASLPVHTDEALNKCIDVFITFTEREKN